MGGGITLHCGVTFMNSYIRFVPAAVVKTCLCRWIVFAFPFAAPLSTRSTIPEVKSSEWIPRFR